MPSRSRPKCLGLACAGIFGLTGFAASVASALPDQDQVSALLEQQTRQFSEASQKGDAATLDRYLDPEVVFTNETGDIASKKDLVEGATPPPANAPPRHVDVTHWALHRQGPDLATATFIDRVTTSLQGQTLVLNFQSTETWARRSDGWKMMSSHTMNVPRLPAAMDLPASQLADYAGVYRLGKAYTVTIKQHGTRLSASVNDGPPVPLFVEVRDVLFAANATNVRRIFQRDTAGHVVGYINRRDGADLIFRKTM